MKILTTILLFNILLISELLADNLNNIETSNLNKLKGNKTIEVPIEILKGASLKIAKNSYQDFNKTIKKVKTMGKILKLRGGSNVYKKNVSKIVLIYNAEMETIGAGSLVDKEGYIITNWHVVQKAKDVAVWFKTPNTSEPIEKNVILAKVIKTDQGKDLGIIKIEKIPNGVTPVLLGSSKNVSVGDTVHAIGHPEGLFWSYTQGVISAKREKYKWAYKDTKHEANMIQTQTPISSGNSGGALLDSQGNLVGINTANLGEGQNLNFAVEVDHAKKILENKSINKVKRSKPIKTTNKNCLATSDDNKNGIIDTCFVDKNKNGKPDGWLIDEDEDGYWETSVIDENEDGKLDFAGTDKNKNGKFEIGYLDEDGDGKIDIIGYDHDEDGTWDEYKKA